MAKIRIHFLVEKPNKDGSASFYWQPSKTAKDAGWNSVAIGKDRFVAHRAAEERNRQYEAWVAGGAIAAQLAIAPRAQGGTLGALIKRYRRDVLDARKPDGSARIAESTAGKVYRPALDKLDAWAGKHPLAYITPARVRVLRDRMLETTSHHTTHQTLKMGRQVFAFGIKVDEIPLGANPFTSFDLAAPSPRSVIWSTPARVAMIAQARALGHLSIALAIQLGFAIGQREGDLLGLTIGQYAEIPEHKMQPEDFATLAKLAPDGVPRGIRIRQNKTRAWIEVPVVGEVRREIEAAIARARSAGRMTILLDDTRSSDDSPAGYDGQTGQGRFQSDFADIRETAAAAADAAGDVELGAELRGLKFLDLRRTCVVYLGELGLDAHLIAAITGHDIDETQRILRIYMPRTTGRAARAIALAAARDVKRENEASNKTA